MAGGAGRLRGAARRRGSDARALEAHLLTQLARFKVPREYVFVDALPRNAMGKVQHFLLRGNCCSEAQAELSATRE